MEVDDDVEIKKAPSHGRKEKSVLQSKLTKLAIQIGYGGKWLIARVECPHFTYLVGTYFSVIISTYVDRASLW